MRTDQPDTRIRFVAAFAAITLASCAHLKPSAHIPRRPPSPPAPASVAAAKPAVTPGPPAAERVAPSPVATRKTPATTKRSLSAARHVPLGREGQPLVASTNSRPHLTTPQSRTVARTEARNPAVHAALAALNASDIVFECPAEMKIGVPDRVSFHFRDDINAALKRHLEASGVAPDDIVHMGISIESALLPDQTNAFDIKPLQTPGASPLQGLAWIVTPKDSGTHNFTLKARLSVVVQGANYDQPFPALTRSVEVNSPSTYYFEDFLREHWSWIVASLVLLGAFVSWLLFSHRAAAAAGR